MTRAACTAAPDKSGFAPSLGRRAPETLEFGDPPENCRPGIEPAVQSDP
jgi:hypothetical protein